VAAPTLTIPAISLGHLTDLVSLSLIIAVIIMVQTAATTRSFPSEPDQPPDVDRDFVGVGAGCLLSGLIGAFPVNASPPRTAVVSETGGRSQLAGLAAVAIIIALLTFGTALLGHIPNAALAGVLLFVAQRIVRVGVMTDIWSRSIAEFLLIVATMLAILVLPIQQGVAIGIILSLTHGVWTTTRARTVEFERIPGTSIWWPAGSVKGGETTPGVKVVALQAPLSFLNAYEFQQALERLPKAGVGLIVIEANAIVEIDYTGAKVLGDAVVRLRAAGVDVAFARLESLRAQRSFARQGLEALLGADHLFHSVEEAVAALAPASGRQA